MKYNLSSCERAEIALRIRAESAGGGAVLEGSEINQVKHIGHPVR